MNVFLHEIVVLARTLSPLHGHASAWQAPRSPAEPSKGASHDHDAHGTARAGTSRKWIIAGLR